MRILSSIVILLTCSFAHSTEISKSKNKLYLTESDCEQADDITLALKTWLENSNIKKDCRIPSVNLSRNKNLCQYDITECVPDHVIKYHGAKPTYSGPNCWNLSLVIKEILPALRYSSPEEMTFYMRPPLCRQLKNDEKRQPGDIGAIRNIQEGETIETHGFIYISERITYSKNGYSRTSPYALQPLENVMRTYKVPMDRGCRQNEIDLNSNVCINAVSYFRCSSMEEYLNKNKNLPQELKETFNNLNLFEQCLERRTLNGTPISDTARQNITDISAALTVYLEKELQENNKNDEEQNFLLGSLQLRLAAIAHQLADTTDKDLSQKVNDLENAIETSVEQLEVKKASQ